MYSDHVYKAGFWVEMSIKIRYHAVFRCNAALLVVAVEGQIIILWFHMNNFLIKLNQPIDGFIA